MMSASADELLTDEFRKLDLRAHTLLEGVPLHDVWQVELPGGGPGLTMVDFREFVSTESLTETNAAVRFLFGLRALLGRFFGWDREPKQAARESFIQHLSAEEQRSSLVPPGTAEGPFQILYVSRQESISEIHNSTVHAFSVFALEEGPTTYRLYWAIYVRPVGRTTAFYMRLIDPFRKLIIYPAMLRHMRARWERGVAGSRLD